MKIIDREITQEDILSLLLKNRHIPKKHIKEFLNPSNPGKIAVNKFGINQEQLKKAVSRINQAIKEKQNILIYGDYDVDGITATAILWQVLYKKNIQVLPFIPDREKDGYGLKAQSFFDFQSQNKIKFDLLITVDNGIVADKEIKKIVDSGVDIIITDHHVANSKLPSSVITLHSTDISGAAVSWILAKELDKNADLGLAALGTVADCLPLNNINRNLVFHGLHSLRSTSNHGIKKLIQISGVKQDSISTYDLGFVLGPRINAVGRLSNPTDALRLLCSSSSIQASKFATILDNYNKDRQNLQSESIELANSKVKNNQEKVLFLAEKSFHPGIIGLIAGRLTETFYLPSIILSINGDVAKGSCRSIKELNIIQSLREISDVFIDLGGHAGAAGFSINTKNIPKFQKQITKIINQKLTGIDLKPEKFIDAQMSLDAVTTKNCQLIQKLEPFGIGNPEPIFLFKDIKITQKRLLGKNQEHLKLKLGDFGVDAIAFRKGDLDKNLKLGDLISFTARLNLNIWNGNISPQLIIKEISSTNN